MSTAPGRPKQARPEAVGEGSPVSGFLDEATAHAEIVRVGRSLFERGYVHATAGNISVQLADGYLITPTDACLGLLDPQRLARLDADGQQIGGDRASKTIVLHRRIYEASAATSQPARCIIHTHSTHLVACSLQHAGAAELLPPITPYFVMKVGRVPHIAYHRPGAPEGLHLTLKSGNFGTPDFFRKAFSRLQA